MSDRPVGELLAGAIAGNSQAWDAIVDRYAGVVWKVVRGFRLDEATAGDVAQTVWLRLVENCDRIREPEKLPGWLAATARNEAIRVSRNLTRTVPTEYDDWNEPEAPGSIEDEIMHDEDVAHMLRCLDDLPPRCQELLRLLTTDPPLDYATIASILGKPVGWIGPTRGRCLDSLRKRMQRIR